MSAPRWSTTFLHGFALAATLLAACGTRFPARAPDPRIARLSPATGPAGGGTLLRIDGLAFQDGARVFFGEAESPRVRVVSSQVLTAEAPPGAEGRRDVTVLNPDGLRGVFKEGFAYAAPSGPPPVLASVYPRTVSAAGGAVAELEGTDLASGLLVFVGGVPASDPVRVSGTLATAVAPAAEAGTVDVAVTNPDGQSARLEGVLSYAASLPDPAPLVTGVLPSSGANAGSIKGTLTGDHFQRGARVYIGGKPAPAVFQSDTLLDVTIPEGRSGGASVGVVNPDGQGDYRPGLFHYYRPRPLITIVAPEGGPIEGGTSVSLVGGNFSEDTVVSFGARPSPAVTLESPRVLRALSPPGATWGLVDVTARNDDGQEDTAGNAFFYYDADHPPPATVTLHVDHVVPATGVIAGGTEIVIVGAGFDGEVQVSVGGAPATGVQKLSANAIVARTPVGTEGAADVSVSVGGGGLAVLQGGFTYYDGLRLDRVRPSTGPTSGGAVVTVLGAGFVAGARVTFGGVESTDVQVLSDFALSVVAPPSLAGQVAVEVSLPNGSSASLAAGFTYFEGLRAQQVLPASGPVGGGTTITVVGAGFADGARVTVGNAAATDVQVVSSTVIGCRTPSAPVPGAVDVTVSLGESSARLPGAFRYFEHATLERVLPSSGPAAGGTPVTLTGTGFAAGTRVFFGAAEAADVRFLSATTLSVRTPASPTGPVDVKVTLPGGFTAERRLAFSFYDASGGSDPLLSAIAPATGPAAGGTAGLLTGRNFAPGAQVWFDSTRATRETRLDSERITFVAPAHARGLADVLVVNPDGRTGTLAQGFAYHDAIGLPPAITAVDPVSASTGSPTPVTVTGADFANGAQVFLGDVPATQVVIVNGGELRATLPSLAPGAWSLTVTNPDGRSATQPDAFRYTTPTPRVDRVVPAIGPTGGGVRVLVQGASFVQGATIRFGAAPATDVLYLETGALLATAPAGAPGKVPVVVQNPGGSAGELPLAFEYREGYEPQPPPQVTSLSPPAGPSSGGSVLLLEGTGFQEGMVVLFGPTPARRVRRGSATQAVVTSPAGAIGTVDVTAVNPDGQVGVLAAGYHYLDPATLPPPPVLTGCIPDHGPQLYPTDLLLTGRRFAAGVRVFVGAMPAPFARRDSETLLSSRAPPGQLGPVDVAVTNPDGNSSVLENGFQFLAAPVVQSVDPTEAPDKGGAQVQIFGEHFVPSARVLFGAVPADGVTYIGPSMLVAVVPVSPPGLVDLRVVNPDGQEGVLPGGFRLRPPPRVQGIVPSAGPMPGGTIAAVQGVDFVEGAQVLLDDVEVPAGFGDDRTLAIRTPAGQFPGQRAVLTVVNPDGQRSDLPLAFTYLDPANFTTPDPVLASVQPGKGPEAGGTWALLSGTGLQTGVVVLFGNRLATGLRTAFGTFVSGQTPGGPRGKVRVAVSNPDGRSSEKLLAFEYADAATLASAPALVTVNPQAGITRGGETVTLGGSGFSTAGAPLVLLAGFPATDVQATAAVTLTAKSGPGIVGLGDVAVTNPDGRSAVLANGWKYEAAAPSFAATSPVEPRSGPTRGGTVVTVRGLDFEAGAEVRFGTALAPGVQFVSPTELRMRTPPGTIGYSDITVVNPGGKNGTLADAFEFLPPPLVTSVNPASGPQAGGNAIIVNGRYFRDTPSPLQLLVGNRPATSVRMESASVVTAVAPAGTGLAAVRIVNGDGQIGELGNGYVYLATIQSPQIVSVSPDNGAAEGGGYVTVIGNNFVAGAKVFFGAAEADQVSVLSSGALTCRVPAGNANDTVDVAVRNPPHPGGTSATKEDAFLYRPGLPFGTLAIKFVSPQQGPCAGGTEILVGGEGIKTGAKVYIDGVEQDDIRVYGPTTIGARTKAWGDPANCVPTRLAVKVMNPTLEFSELTGASGFLYSGGNRRFVLADGDRVPAESGDRKDSYTPVLARLSGTSGGGRALGDILVGRSGARGGYSCTPSPCTYSYDPGDFLYYTPRWDLARGVFWNDSFSSLRKYDPACAVKVRDIDKSCGTPPRVEHTTNQMYMPLVADFDLNGWPDVLYYEAGEVNNAGTQEGAIVVLYNDAGVLTRYTLGTFGRSSTAASTFCSSAGVCGTGTWTGHAIANLDMDAAGKLDLVVSTTHIDFMVRNDSSPTEAGRAAWTTWVPSGSASRMLYQGGTAPAGDNSTGVAAGDVDGDGDADLVFGGWNIPIKTYLSDLAQLVQSTGSLATAQTQFRLRDAAGAPFNTSTAWSGPMRRPVLADFDKDGDLDLYMPHSARQDEYWGNDGQGKFASETVTAAPVVARCASGRRLPARTADDIWMTLPLDLDADGDLDLVQWASAGYARPLRIYRNDPQSNSPQRGGCFADATNLFFPTAPPAAGPLGVAVIAQNMGFGDLDGDGYPDAFMAGADGQQARVYFNVAEEGQRVFRDGSRVRLPSRWDRYTLGATFADVDGDTDQDLLLSTSDFPLNSNVSGSNYYRGAADSRLRLYLNDGAGYFSDATARLPARTVLASRIVVADLTDDRRPDILVPNFSDVGDADGEYRLYVNDGAGVFTDESALRLPPGFYATLYGRAVTVADLDGDGDLDIVAGGSGTTSNGRGCVRVWLNTGAGYFADISPTAVPQFPWDNDDCTNGNYSAGASSYNHTRDIVVSDFDFNGTPDLFLARHRSNLLMLNCIDAATRRPVFFSSVGGAPCASPSAPWVPPGGTTSAAAYTRVDGAEVVTDILLDQDPATGAGRRLLRGSSVAPGRLSDETPAYLPGGLPDIADVRDSAQLLVPLDYDGDSDPDFVYVAAGQNRLLRNGGRFTDVAQEAGASDPFPRPRNDDGRGAAVADVDGDGYPDLFLLNVWNPRILLNRP